MNPNSWKVLLTDIILREQYWEKQCLLFSLLHYSQNEIYATLEKRVRRAHILDLFMTSFVILKLENKKLITATLHMKKNSLTDRVA